MFYQISQGAKIISYDIVLNLEVAGGQELFRSDANSERYGLITQAANPRTNPDGLPIGLTKTVVTEGRWKGDSIGMNCAVCHTAQLTYEGKLIRIDGGVSNTNEIARLAGLYCGTQMTKLLTAVLQEFSRDSTRVVLTGYFPIFSKASDFKRIEEYLIGNLVHVPQQQELSEQRVIILDRVVENAQIFWIESTAALKQAITSVGSARIRFAEVPFQDENAMFAHDPWLWEVHLKGVELVPEDPVAAARKITCDKFHPNPLDRSACYIASAGHPNVKGSAAFKETILTVLAGWK